MTNAAYAGAVALARRSQGHPVWAVTPTRSMAARAQALLQLHAGHRLATLPPAARRMAPKQSGQGYSRAAQPKLLALGAPAISRPQIIVSAAGGYRHSPDAKAASAGALNRSGGRTPSALAVSMGTRLASAARSVASPPLTAAFAGRGGNMSQTQVKPGLGKAAAVRTAAVGGMLSGKAGLSAAPLAAVHTRHQLSASAPTTGTTPGFHRTVRQPAAKAAAGDVYLDKNLVGYHLAAAITAEQTRAATRPNASAASFNCSMAALRPTGAGL